MCTCYKPACYTHKTHNQIILTGLWNIENALLTETWLWFFKSVYAFRPNEDFYRQFGSVMLSRYGNVSGSLPETAAEAFAAGIKPTFQQFVTYLLDPETESRSIFNEHWRQVSVWRSYALTSVTWLDVVRSQCAYSHVSTPLLWRESVKSGLSLHQ